MTQTNNKQMENEGIQNENTESEYKEERVKEQIEKTKQNKKFIKKKKEFNYYQYFYTIKKEITFIQDENKTQNKHISNKYTFFK